MKNISEYKLLPDSELTKKIKEDKDEFLFSILYNRYRNLIFNISFKMLDDRIAAEDMIQETFIKAWKYFDGYEEKNAFNYWICTIAKHCCIDYLRKMNSKNFLVFVSNYGNAEEQYPIDEKDSGICDREYLHNSIDKLKEKEKEMVLKVLDGYTYEEIGREDNVSRGTAYVKIRRALRKLNIDKKKLMVV